MYLEDIEDVRFALEDSRTQRVGGRLLGLHPDLDYVVDFANAHLACIAPLYTAAVLHDYRNAGRRIPFAR